MGRATRIVVLAAMALSAPVLAGTEAAADAADITPPVVKAIKDPPFPDGLNHWWITPVHVTWSVTDPESPPDIVVGCEDEWVFEDGNIDFWCVAMSAGGRTEALTHVGLDQKPPSVQIRNLKPRTYTTSTLPALDDIGCVAADRVSGILDGCVLSGYSAEPGDHVLSGFAKNRAGLTTTTTVPYTVVGGDGTPPVVIPVVSPRAPDGQDGWYRATPSVSWTVQDAESAVTSRQGCETTTIGQDTPNATLTCRATSRGGTTTKAFTLKHDGTPPSVPVIVGIAPGVYYPNAPLPPRDQIRCTSVDSTSGAACTITGYGRAVGTHTVTATAVNGAGATSTSQLVFVVKPDETPPVVRPLFTPDRPDGRNGWFTAPVVELDWKVNDTRSNIVTRRGCAPGRVTADTAGTSFRCLVRSAGGTTDRIVTIKRDASPPTTPQFKGIAPKTYARATVPPASAVTCTSSDRTSGASCAIAGYGTSIGTHSIVARATNGAGLTNASSLTYAVSP